MHQGPGRRSHLDPPPVPRKTFAALRRSQSAPVRRVQRVRERSRDQASSCRYPPRQGYRRRRRHRRHRHPAPRQHLRVRPLAQTSAESPRASCVAAGSSATPAALHLTRESMRKGRHSFAAAKEERGGAEGFWFGLLEPLLTNEIFTYDKIYLTVLRFKFTQDLHLTIV